jgi:hypothetical protein
MFDGSDLWLYALGGLSESSGDSEPAILTRINWSGMTSSQDWHVSDIGYRIYGFAEEKTWEGASRGAMVFDGQNIIASGHHWVQGTATDFSQVVRKLPRIAMNF